MSFKRVLIFIMLAATLLTSAALTNAQDALTAAGEYTGSLEALNGTQLTVSGLTFDVSGVTPDDDVVWEPGLLVEVSFTASGGALTATYVDAMEDDENGDGGYLVGTLEAVSAESVTVGGLTFGVASDGFDDDVIYEVGLTVEIEFDLTEGLFTASGVWGWDAPEDDDDSNDDEPSVSEIYGVVEALDGTTIVVSGTSFDITTAEISGLVEIGAWVELGFITAEDGTATAVYVAGEDDDIDTPDEDEDEDEQPYLTLTGILESYEGSTMVVGGVTIDVSFAVIDDDDDLVIGGYVTVIFDDVGDEVVAIFVIPHGSEDDGSDDDNGDEDDGSEDDDDGSDVCEDPSGWYSYEVQSGDTLSSIAVAAGITLEALMTANCLTDANMISVGYELYTPVELSSGDVDNGDDDSDEDSDDDSDEDSDDDSSDDEDNGDNDGGDDDGGDDDGGDDDGGDDDGGDDDGGDDDGGDDDGGDDDGGDDDGSDEEEDN